MYLLLEWEGIEVNIVFYIEREGFLKKAFTFYVKASGHLCKRPGDLIKYSCNS